MYQHDRNKKGQNVGQQRYREAFGLFQSDGGTPYPCRQSEINIHHSRKFLRPNKGPSESTIEAIIEFIRHDKETRKIPPRESAAIERLIEGILDAEENGYGPDVIVKAFTDLDLVFFDERLRGNVCVQWESEEYFRQWRVPAGAWGFTVRSQPGESRQCQMKLNAKTILLDVSTDTLFKTMFGTMLHEKCHAYEHIRCSPEECDQGDGHDKHFRTKIHAVHRRAHHLLGLWAIDKRESYRKDHFMSQEWSNDWTDATDNTKIQSSKKGKSWEPGGDNRKIKATKGKKKGRAGRS